eukprot:gene10169-7123_t
MEGPPNGVNKKIPVMRVLFFPVGRTTYEVETDVLQSLASNHFIIPQITIPNKLLTFDIYIYR